MKKQKEISIIAVDTSTNLANRLSSLFSKKNVKVHREYSIDRVIEKFESKTYDVLIVTSDAFKAGRMDGIELLEVIAAKSPATQILFLAEPHEIGTAMSALKAGTFQYAKLPMGDEELSLLVKTAIEKKPVYGTNVFLESKKRRIRLEKLVGKSEAMQDAYRQIRQAAATDIPILLMGETGTGKDLCREGYTRTK